MKVSDLIRVLLEFDQQCISARPSTWGTFAQMVHALAEHAEPSMSRGPGPDIFGDWASIDLDQVHRRAPRELKQPVLEAIEAADVAAKNLDSAMASLEAIHDAEREDGESWEDFAAGLKAIALAEIRREDPTYGSGFGKES